jgi:hypothetical protein
MAENAPTVGGFTGNPAAALQVTGSGACCGSPGQTAGAMLPPPGDPCCGNQQAAAEADSCCGTPVEPDVAAAGAGCCS